MKKRRYLSTVVAIVVLLALAGVAAAFTMINVDGVWGTADTNGADCDRWATGPAGGSTNYDSPTNISNTSTAIQTGSITDWNQIRYGFTGSTDNCRDLTTPVGFGTQSGFGFDGVDDVNEGTGLDNGTPFYLGKFCHFNNPISASNLMAYADLTITVSDLQCPTGATISPAAPNNKLVFSYRFTLDETPNQPPCLYSGTTICPDKVTVGPLSNVANFTCDFGGGTTPAAYTIEILGFIPEATGGTCPGTYNADLVSDEFISDEGNDRCACLWARVKDYKPPTAVDLLSFAATAEKKAVTLTWETATETDNLGFNLYRAEAVDGERTKINLQLIPTNVPPGSPFGGVYSYTDTILKYKQTYFYWLEDLDIYGNAELHGPVEVSPTAKLRNQPPASLNGLGKSPETEGQTR